MATLLEFIGIGFIPAFILLDLFYRQRRYETVRFWRVRAGIVTVVNFFLTIAIALTWGSLLASNSLLQLSSLGTLGGAAAGILIYEFFHYWYHRLAHQSNVLWRGAHQMHHSAESLDAFGAYYQHPIDVFFFTSISILVFFPLLGLTPEAGALGAAFLTFNAMFQHANIATPRWLGYIIQRPESHAVHHGRGVHQYNYSDLPLWDMLFGTFRNPQTQDGPVGFYTGASAKIIDMLIFKDVADINPVTEQKSTSAMQKTA